MLALLSIGAIVFFVKSIIDLFSISSDDDDKYKGYD